MYAIARHERGSAHAVATRPLDVGPDLYRFLNGTLPEKRNPTVLRAISDLRAKRLYLACHCSPDRADPPLYAPVATPGGGVTLRRMPERGQHSGDCPLAFTPSERAEPNQANTKSGANPVPKQPPQFLEQVVASHLGESRDDSPARAAPSVAHQALARQLFWLLQAAGLQTCPVSSAGSPAQRIRDVARNIVLPKGLMLSDVLFCNARAWTEGWMDAAFAKCAQAGQTPQAILVCPVVAANRLQAWVQFTEDGPHVPVGGSLAIYGEDTAAARYPMLMLAKVLYGRNRTVELTKAYLHPMVSLEHWLLVDSDYEREALRALLGTTEALAREGVHCRIDKPLFDWADTRARPDFVVQAQRGGRQTTLMVETIGSTDPTYVERKRGTIQRLGAYAVVRDLRYLRDGDADRRLHESTVKQIHAAL